MTGGAGVSAARGRPSNAPTSDQPPVSVQTDLTLILSDEVGSLAQAFTILGGAGVNVVGHGGFLAWAGEGVLHMIADDPERARAALHEAGIEVREEREVIVFAVAPRPGALAESLRAVADAGINVDLTYVTADSRAVIGVNDVQRAMRALEAAG